MTTISVHLYDLRSESGRDLNAFLQRVTHTPKANRWRQLPSGHNVAMLDLRRGGASRPNVWICDFVTERTVGPGKIRRDSEIESFDFDTGEAFGEETGAIFDLENGWFGAQWNLHGVRAQSMIEYINTYEHDPDSDWVATPKIDPNLEETLLRKSNLRVARIKFRMTPAINSTLRKSGLGLGSALARTAAESHAVTLSVELNMSHNDGFLNRDVFALIRELATEDSDVLKLEVRGREGEVGQDETLNVLEQRIVSKFDTAHLEITNCRFTLRSRQQALLGVHGGWVTTLLD